MFYKNAEARFGKDEDLYYYKALFHFELKELEKAKKILELVTKEHPKFNKFIKEREHLMKLISEELSTK